jgi:predicted HAD superfamily phosphohydrolase YqeG
MADKRFADLDIERCIAYTVILDVDGTLVKDSGETMDTDTATVLQTLSERTDVYLCSNAQNSHRMEVLVAGTNAHSISSSYKKPDKRVVAELEALKLKPYLVIGDKFLTDGLLACNLKVPFIRVRRYMNAKEHWRITASYALDAMFGRVLFLLCRLSPL